MVSHPQPSRSFKESLDRINILRKVDPKEIDPAGRTILMEHGARVKHVIVFFHGFTNSPRQFETLGKQFYELGYNVYIARIPYHGLKESISANLEKLTAEDLAATSDETIEIEINEILYYII